MSVVCFSPIQTALHAHHPSVWLPYSALDHLQLALSKAPPRTILEQVSSVYTHTLHGLMQRLVHIVHNCAYKLCIWLPLISAGAYKISYWVKV